MKKLLCGLLLICLLCTLLMSCSQTDKETINLLDYDDIELVITENGRDALRILVDGNEVDVQSRGGSTITSYNVSILTVTITSKEICVKWSIKNSGTLTERYDRAGYSYYISILE